MVISSDFFWEKKRVGEKIQNKWRTPFIYRCY